MAAPATGRWVLTSQQGLDALRYDPAATADESQLGPEDVLVELQAASLNYRELVVASSNTPGMPTTGILPDLIPGSDGAGRVLAVGSSVPDGTLAPGQLVVTHIVPRVADDALPSAAEVCAGLGQKEHGTLCRRGVFHYTALVPVPAGWAMTPAQTASLTCSGLTAWNCVMGFKGREVAKGDWVLTQGTGGVSIAALQIAVAAGATVVATTSSDAKAERLRALGAAHVLNYRTHPDWGVRAKALTPDGRGIDHVVDVGGARTLSESVNAVRIDGLVTSAGLIGGTDAEAPSLMAPIIHQCIVRGLWLGTRNMLRDMLAWLDDKKVSLVVDDVEFTLEDAKSAYERLKKQEHFAKIVIKMN